MISEVSRAPIIAFALVWVTKAEVTKTDPSFVNLFEFNIISGKMTLFTIIVVDNIAIIFFFAPTSDVGISCINLHSRGWVWVLFFILFFLQPSSLLLFPSFFGVFHTSGGIFWTRSLELLIFVLRFFLFWVFY